MKPQSLEQLTSEYQQSVLHDMPSAKPLQKSVAIFGNRIALSITETAAYLGLSVKKVERLCKTGELKSKLAGRRVLIPVAAIETWLNSKE